MVLPRLLQRRRSPAGPGRSSGHGGQPDLGSVAERCEALRRYVAAADGQLVVVLEHGGADEPNDGRGVWSDADDFSAAFHFAIQALDRVGAGDLRPLLAREGGEGEDVVTGVFYSFGQLGRMLA